MQLIAARTEHLAAIMEIIRDAQNYLASLGTDQWQDGYPSEEMVSADIARQESYLVLDNDLSAMATAMLSTRPEPSYAIIEGNWLSSSGATYGVIHRMAVAKSHRGEGMARYIMRQAEARLQVKKIASLRIDTHANNQGMQSLLMSSGYRYCGIIHLDYGAERLAYEKVF